MTRGERFAHALRAAAGYWRAHELALIGYTLMVGAMCITLHDTSAFAAWYVPSPWLPWAWAVYVDVAIIGYTRAVTRNKGNREAWAAFVWFTLWSIVANIAAMVARYDLLRMGHVVDAIRAQGWFMWVSCVACGASIPVSVFVFARTATRGAVVASTGSANGSAKRAPAGDVAERVRAAVRAEPKASDRALARMAGVSVGSVRKYKGG
jgi:hypothetical protein